LFGAVFGKWNAKLGGHAIFQNALAFLFALFLGKKREKEMKHIFMFSTALGYGPESGPC